MAEDTIKIPGVDKPLPKKWVYVGGAALLGFIVYAYYSRYRELEDTPTVFGEGYDEFGNLLGADPARTPGGGGLFDQTPEEGFGFKTNAEWTQFALDEMARGGIDRAKAGVALGKFTGNQLLTPKEVEWVRYAIAVAGYPPVGDFDIREQPAPPAEVSLSAPKGFKATGGVDKAILSWNAVAGATGYQIQLRGLAWRSVGNVTSHEVDFPEQTRPNTWRFYVRAVADGKTGPAATTTGRVSPSKNARPSAPRHLQASSNRSTIQWRWSGVPSADYYKVLLQIGRPGGGTKTIRSTTVRRSEWRTRGLRPGHAYRIRVRAERRGVGTSPYVTLVYRTKG